MTDFNYQKAYCTLALPAFNALNKAQKAAFNTCHGLVADLRQQRGNLNIPLSKDIRKALDPLSCKELAELSRASFYTGHWQLGLLPHPFNNKSGQSWKVANCCDQLLRERLLPYRTLQIQEGKLRVTFSNKDCWLWEEFSLATEENLETFKNCNLNFGENTLNESANILKSQIGDLWPNVDTVPPNDLYLEYLELARKKREKEAITRAEQNVIDAEKERDFLLYCVNRGVSIENVIYYNNRGKFCFGWRDKLTKQEAEEIQTTLDTQGGHVIKGSCPYDMEFKTV